MLWFAVPITSTKSLVEFQAASPEKYQGNASVKCRCILFCVHQLDGFVRGSVHVVRKLPCLGEWLQDLFAASCGVLNKPVVGGSIRSFAYGAWIVNFYLVRSS